MPEDHASGPDADSDVPLPPRHLRILEMLSETPALEVGRLSEALGVSAVTIRSDLDALDRRQLLRRVRGGATAIRAARFERPAGLPGQDFGEEKRRIGEMAARMVRPGETIVLDAGTTTLAMAMALPEGLRDVLVVTSSLDVAIALHRHPGVSVMVTGGKLKETGRNAGAHALVSPFGTLLLGQVNADCAYLCCTGIDPERGFTNAHFDEVEIKRAMIAASRRSLMLGDSGKIGHIGGARIAGPSEVDTLLTDAGAHAGDVAALEAAGLRVLLA